MNIQTNSTFPKSKTRGGKVYKRRSARSLGAQLPVEEVLEKFDKLTDSGGGQYQACCPAHADSDPSLSLKVNDDGSIVMFCHRGCEYEEIVQALKLDYADFDIRKDYSPNHSHPVSKSPPAQRSGRTGIAVGRLVAAQDATRDWGALAQQYYEALTDEVLLRFAKDLFLPPPILDIVFVGQMELKGESVLTFPEFNADGEVVGIATRSLDGSKGFLPGGHRGLTLPRYSLPEDEDIFIAEGVSDVCALLAMELPAIGRPSAGGGSQYLIDLLEPLPPDCRLVFMGDNDEKPDGSWPGRDGVDRVAQEVAEALRRDVEIVYPPDGAKDVREWLHQVMAHDVH